jgi:hypothetical protein
MDGIGDDHAEQENPSSERQISFHSYAESRPKKKNMIVKGGLLGGEVERAEGGKKESGGG